MTKTFVFGISDCYVCNNSLNVPNNAAKCYGCEKMEPSISKTSKQLVQFRYFPNGWGISDSTVVETY